MVNALNLTFVKSLKLKVLIYAKFVVKFERRRTKFSGCRTTGHQDKWYSLCGVQLSCCPFVQVLNDSNAQFPDIKI